MKGRAGRVIVWLLVGGAPAAAGERAAPMGAATAIVAVEAAVGRDAVAVAIRANGGLSPGAVRRVEHFRPRLVLDFPGLAAEAGPVTRVGVGPVDRVRVDRQSVALTRVVLELSRSAPYRVEAAEPGSPTLRIVFPLPPARPEARVEARPGPRPDAGRRIAVGAAAPAGTARLPAQPPAGGRSTPATRCRWTSRTRTCGPCSGCSPRSAP